jgi:hypothetical protein
MIDVMIVGVLSPELIRTFVPAVCGGLTEMVAFSGPAPAVPARETSTPRSVNEPAVAGLGGTLITT